jgi:UTP-glucose-1-phosphate uridylyltransferase
MDQGCAFGDRPVLMTFDGDRLETRELTVKNELYFVLVDLQAQKNTLEILNRLNRCYPVAENDQERGVQKLLGPINKQVIHEAVNALQNGDERALGSLLVEAQDYFDSLATPVCPEELTAPALHKLLTYQPLKAHAWGSKGVGSQGDGTAQILAKSIQDQEAIFQIVENELKLSALKLTLHTGPKVRKAVIPAAGFGTRLFPASKATKKELFPVIDRDGIAKPAILLIVEEALQAGIEEIIIIVQKDDLSDFQNFFNTQISIENYNKLPANFQEYSRRILDIGRRITFVIQNSQEGFGHAVYTAHEAVGSEPFLLMLGDHIYRSTTQISCAQQLVDAYQQHGKSVVGLRLTPEEKIANFGTVSGVWIDPNSLLNITEFAEKPTLEYAHNNLRIPGMPDDQFLTVFGQYILSPEIFDYLGENIQNNYRERGEFQLTSALDRLRKAEGFMGLVMNGTRFDIGLPDYYLETLVAYRKE